MGPIWLISILLFGPIHDPSITITFNNLLVMPFLFILNIVILVVLAYRRGWMALGMLSVLAVNLFIGLILRMGSDSVCAVPVFVESLDLSIHETPLTPTPTATLGPTATYVPTDLPVTVAPDASSLAEGGVTSNNQWKPYFQDINSVTMVLVPRGCFMMGSNDGTTDEQPINRQCFEKPFWIDLTEVTNGQFSRLGGRANQAGTWPGANQPRDTIDWDEARDFCARRGSRLPTEAEWEYAARGPDDLVYPWGNDFTADKVFSGKPDDGSADVGSKPAGASWVGALDMSGNVAEWTSSLFKPYPYDPTDGREDATAAGARTIRGGDWVNTDYSVRATFRAPPTGWNVGFRCAHPY